MFKKLISVIAIICLMATSVVVFAENENETAETQLSFTNTNLILIQSAGVASKHYTVSLSKNDFGMYYLPLPTLEKGQKIGSYKFTHLTESYGANSIYYVKFPYDEGVTFTTGLTTASLSIAPRISFPGDYVAQDSKSETSLGKIITTTRNTYLNTVDLTSYANECYNNNVGNNFIIMMRPVSSGFYFCPLTAVAGDKTPTVTYTVETSDPLALVESTPENGAQSVASSTDVSFTFNNPLDNASVTVNGESAQCSVYGVTVTLDSVLEQYKEYAVTVNATDKNGSTLETTISFTTGCKTIVTNDKTGGETYVVKASGATPTGSSTIQLDYDANYQFVICKIPVADLKGKLVDYFEFQFVGNVANNITPIKFAGDDWDISTITTDDDAVKSIIGSYRNYKVSDSTDIVKLANYIQQWTLDITSYAKECIANEQDYMYIAFTSLSTCAMYGYGSSYEPNWSYGIIDPEFKTVEEVKIVAADNADGYDAEGLTAISKGSSYKAITSITNKTAENMTVVIAIADYNDDTLESVSLKTVEVKSGAFEKLVETDAITVSSGSTKAKAFLWKALGNEPYGENLEVMVQ